MRVRLRRPRTIAAAATVIGAVAVIAAVVPLAVPAQDSSDGRTIEASITNGWSVPMTVYAQVDNGEITSKTGPTPFVLEPGKTFDFNTAGPEDDPCEYDDAETCLESIIFVDLGDTSDNPTSGFRKAARNIKPFNTAGVAAPNKEGGDDQVRLGNGDYEFTMYAWNPRGEINQTCVDQREGFDVAEDDSGVAVLDFEVDWTITRDQYNSGYDGC